MDMDTDISEIFVEILWTCLEASVECYILTRIVRIIERLLLEVFGFDRVWTRIPILCVVWVVSRPYRGLFMELLLETCYRAFGEEGMARELGVMRRMKGMMIQLPDGDDWD